MCPDSTGFQIPSSECLSSKPKSRQLQGGLRFSARVARQLGSGLPCEPPYLEDPISNIALASANLAIGGLRNELGWFERKSRPGPHASFRQCKEPTIKPPILSGLRAPFPSFLGGGGKCPLSPREACCSLFLYFLGGEVPLSSATKGRVLRAMFPTFLGRACPFSTEGRQFFSFPFPFPFLASLFLFWEGGGRGISVHQLLGVEWI